MCKTSEKKKKKKIKRKKKEKKKKKRKGFEVPLLQPWTRLQRRRPPQH